MRARPGAALLLAVLVLLVLDCVLLGTLQLALLERRMAANADTALRLRLTAENAARAGAASWSAAFDTLRAGAPPVPVLDGTTHDRLVYAATLERLSDVLFLLHAHAGEPAPAFGRAAASLLLRLPALPPSIDAAPAALSVNGQLTIAGQVSAATEGCLRPGDAVRIPALEQIRLLGDGVIDGVVSFLPPRADLTLALPRAADALRAEVPIGVRLAEETLVVDADGSGIIFASGDVVLNPGVAFNGLIIAGGGVTVERGSVLNGALHAAGDVRVDGVIRLDACVVDRLIATARLRLPRPARARAWLPAFQARSRPVPPDRAQFAQRFAIFFLPPRSFFL